MTEIRKCDQCGEKIEGIKIAVLGIRGYGKSPDFCSKKCLAEYFKIELPFLEKKDYLRSLLTVLFCILVLEVCIIVMVAVS